MLELTNMTGVNISIFIILIGALFIYFGRIIGDTRVERYDKLGYYIEGIIFSAVYIYIPFLFAYYIYIKNLFTGSSLLWFFMLGVILLCLSWNLIAHEFFRKLGLLDEFKKITAQKLNQLKELNSFAGKLAKSKYGEDWFKSNYGLSYAEAFYKIPIKLFGNRGILGIFSFLTILSNLQLYESKELLTSGFSLLLAFFILTMVALAYGFGNAYYPPGKIYMVDGSIIEGKILKFSEYVYVLKDDKKIFINKDKINYIEESKFKEKVIE